MINALPRRLARALALVPLVACARGDAGTAGTAGTAEPADRPASLLVKPDPVAVTVSVDTAARATQLVSARQGGSVVTLDHERGMMYSLTIPPNGLLADERITITPVRAVRGLPLSGGLTGAVRLEPDGLQLAAPATLRIVRFDAANARLGTPAGPHVGFAAEGDGRELRLAVASTSDSGVVVHLSHFSIHGSGKGTLGDIAAQVAHAPSSPAGQYEQRAAAVIEQASAKAGTDAASVSKRTDPAGYAELVKLHLARYYDVVRPALVAARGSDEALPGAATMFNSWLAEFQHFGGEDDELDKEYADGRALLEAALRAAYDRAVARCRKGVDLGAVATMLVIERTSQMLGFDMGEMFPRLKEEMDACTAVDVVFDSKIDFTSSDGVTNAHDVVHAEVPLQFDLAKGAFYGSGPLDYVSASGAGDGRMGELFGGCIVRVLGPSRDGTFEVLGLFLASNPKKDARAALGDSIALLIDPGRPQVKHRAERCKPLLGLASAEGQVFEGDGWRPGWEDHHRGEQMEWIDGAARSLDMSETAEPRLVWLIDRWERGTGTALARRTFEQAKSNAFGRFVERTTIELRRRPRS